MIKEIFENGETHICKGMQFEICSLKGNTKEYLEEIFKENAYETTEGIHKVSFGMIEGRAVSYRNDKEECVEFALDISDGEILNIWIAKEI